MTIVCLLVFGALKINTCEYHFYFYLVLHSTDCTVYSISSQMGKIHTWCHTVECSCIGEVSRAQ